MVRRFDPIVLWQAVVGLLLLAGWEAVGDISAAPGPAVPA
jgi:hypothetical protein